ncbi:hypothetical protein MMC34_008713, partial [Xylographa carneopallida]|nr:hypothetical protein [Xylographa carneopallida]
MSSNRPQLFTPQPHRNPPRLLPSSLPRAMPAYTPSKPVLASTADKENTARPTDVPSLPARTALFLSPPSAVSTRSSVCSIRSSVSPLSTSSALSLHVSPRAVLGPRSPNIRLLPVRAADAIKQTAPVKPRPTAAAAAIKSAKRVSPPLLGQRKQQAAAAANNNKPKRLSPTAAAGPTASSALQRQISQLQAQLAAEQSRAVAAVSELRSVRARLFEAERRSEWLTEEDEEDVKQFWHDVDEWDFYHAVNSDRSSASEAEEEQEDEEDEEDEEADETAESEEGDDDDVDDEE